MYKLSAAGKRYLENPLTSGRVWKNGQRFNLATATQEQMQMLYADGKGSLVEKVKPSPAPASTPKPEKKEEKGDKK